MKNFINTALLKEQLKRFWPIAAVTMLGYFVFIVRPMYLQPITNAHLAGQAAARFTAGLLHNTNMFMLIAMVAVPFITALALYAYPYKVASATAFHSFPLNRRQLFFTHALAGLILILVPLVVLCLIILMPVRQVTAGFHSTNYGWPVPITIDTFGILTGDVINTPALVASFFLQSALGFAMYFALFTLAASLSGNRVVAVVLSGAVALAPVVLVGLGETIAPYYVFGFTENWFSYTLVVAAHTQPVLLAVGRVINNALVAGIISLYISYSLITLTGFGLAYLAYHLRRQERAGDIVVFTPVNRVMIFLFSVAGMLVFGVLTRATFGGRAGFYAGFVLGFVIAYLAVQIIAEKTFFIGRKIKYLFSYGAVALGVYVLLLAVANIGFRNYVYFVPESREIAGVHIGSLRHRPRFYRNPDNWPNLFIDDPATIEHVREIHQGIINEHHSIQQSRWSDVDARHLTHFSFAYLLNDGRLVSRSYILPNYLFNSLGIRELMASDPVILAPLLDIRNPERINHITFTVTDPVQGISAALGAAYTGGGFVSTADTIVVSDAHQIAELLEAIRKDILNSFRGTARSAVPQYLIHVGIVNRREYDTLTHFRIFFQPTVPLCGYTADWLRDNGELPWVLE